MNLFPRLGNTRWKMLAGVTMALSIGSLLRAADQPPGTFAFSVSAPPKFSVRAIHDAAIHAATHRGWAIKDDKERQIVIELVHGKDDAVITFLVADDKVDAYCQSYKLVSGQRQPADQPKRWFKYLVEDINREFHTQGGGA